jgi:hypothetical protein
MNCLEKIRVNLINHEVFMITTNLYFEMGKNIYYQNLFEKDMDYMKNEVASQNAQSFFKTFFADFNIKESRFKTLLLNSTIANNKSEQLYKNLIDVFRRIHVEDVEPFNLQVTEISDLFHLIFDNVVSPEMLKYRKIGKTKGMFNAETISVREELERYLEQVNKLEQDKTIEPIFLYLNFMVDFINMEVFDFPYNDSLGLLIFYILMGENKFHAGDFIAFFAKLNLYKEDYYEIISRIKVQSKQGLSDLMPLMKFFVNIFNGMYLDLNQKARDYQYDHNLEINKTDYIENTIYKLPEVFSKEDIRKKHPSISDSTINRTLKRLQEDNVIRAVGKGRAAKWVRIVKKDKKRQFEGQISLDLGE